jgi:hypothetical protein
MTRKSKAVFKMAGYTYPGTSPVTKKAGPEPQQIDVDLLHEEETREIEEYVVPNPKNKFVASIGASIRNTGKRPKVKK